MEHQTRGDAIREGIAWDEGRKYGKSHRPGDVTTEQMWEACREQAGCTDWFDVFKYGAQSVWREEG